MRKWVLAAVAALSAGQVEAAPWTFIFRLDGESSDFEWITLDYKSDTVVDYYLFGADNEVSNPPVLAASPSKSVILELNIHLSPTDGWVMKGWDDGAALAGGEAWGGYSSPLFDGIEFAGSYQFYEAYDDYVTGRIAGVWTARTGYYNPSPVPLPATAPLLIGAVGLLGLRRRFRG